MALTEIDRISPRGFGNVADNRHIRENQRMDSLARRPHWLKHLLLSFLLGLPLCMAAQIHLENRIMPWSSRHGLNVATSVDEGSLDLNLRYLRLGLRTGVYAGLGLPVKTGLQRSVSLEGGWMFFPNPFHSRMDPFFHVRTQLTHEEGQYRADLPSHALINGRPLAWMLRLQAGYGFNVNLGKYLYLQHLLGLGYGLEYIPNTKTLGRVTLVFSVGAGYHVFSKLAHRKQKGNPHGGGAD